MNQYLYPWHDSHGHNKIGVINARSFSACIDKLSEQLINKYDDLEDNGDFEDLVKQLSEKYDVHIGDIYDINEF